MINEEGINEGNRLNEMDCIRLLINSINAGNAEAAVIYTYLLEKGIIFEQDIDESIRFYQIARDLGCKEFELVINKIKKREQPVIMEKVVVRRDYPLFKGGLATDEGVNYAIMLLRHNDPLDESAAIRYIENCIKKRNLTLL